VNGSYNYIAKLLYLPIAIGRTNELKSQHLVPPFQAKLLNLTVKVAPLDVDVVGSFGYVPVVLLELKFDVFAFCEIFILLEVGKLVKIGLRRGGGIGYRGG
jgi:hypothetical protein